VCICVGGGGYGALTTYVFSAVSMFVSVGVMERGGGRESVCVSVCARARVRVCVCVCAYVCVCV